MSNLYISVSGCDGGSTGPQGIYTQLKKNSLFLPIDTIPDNISENVARVSKIATEHFDKNIYLIGHSMGAAVALVAAYELNKNNTNLVKGVLLISPQTDGLQVMRELQLSILFIHGEKDDVFPLREIEPSFQTYEFKKKMIQIAGVGHNLNPKNGSSQSFTKILAGQIFEEMTHFFNNESKSGETKVIQINEPLSQFAKFRSFFF